MRAICTRSSSRKVKLCIRCCPCSEHALQHAPQHAPQHAHETLVEYPTPTSSNLQRLRRPHSQASTKTATHCSWPQWNSCLLYTSDAADDLTRVDLGGCRIIK